MKIRALAIVAAFALPTLALADEPVPPPDQSTNRTTDKTTDKTNEKTTNTNKPTDKPTDKTAKAGKLSEGDVKIIAHLHHVNQMEIDLGKVAQRSGTASLKNYAETLEKDHQSADKDLVSFAKQRKLAAIPPEKPQTDTEKQEHKDMMAKMQRLKMLKGAEFDREFLSMMIADHDKELTRIDVSIGAASDPDLQNMLKSIKPVLQRHADQARDLQKSPQASADRPMDRPTPASPDRPSDRPGDRPNDKLPSQR